MYYLGVEYTVVVNPWAVYINLSAPLDLDQRNALREMVREEYAKQVKSKDVPILIADA